MKQKLLLVLFCVTCSLFNLFGVDKLPDIEQEDIVVNLQEKEENKEAGNEDGELQAIPPFVGLAPYKEGTKESSVCALLMRDDVKKGISKKKSQETKRNVLVVAGIGSFFGIAFTAFCVAVKKLISDGSCCGKGCCGGSCCPCHM